MKVVNVEIKEDDGTQPRSVLVDVETVDGMMCIRPHGYGQPKKWPIDLEIVNGRLVLHVWNNGSKPTTIDLETLRGQS